MQQECCIIVQSRTMEPENTMKSFIVTVTLCGLPADLYLDGNCAIAATNEVLTKLSLSADRWVHTVEQSNG